MSGQFRGNLPERKYLSIRGFKGRWDTSLMFTIQAMFSHYESIIVSNTLKPEKQTSSPLVLLPIAM